MNDERDNVSLILCPSLYLGHANGDALLFNEATQAILKPCPALTSLYDKFQTGLSIQGVADALNISTPEAWKFADGLIDAGVLDIIAVDAGAIDVKHRMFLDLTVTTAAFFFSGDRSAQIAQELFGDAEVEPNHSDNICAVGERRDGLVIAANNDEDYECSWTEAGAALRSTLTSFVLNDLDDIALHCATIGVGEDAILILGEPQAGKSVLSLAMMLSGFEIAGDDVAVLSQDGTVRAVPFPLTLKSSAWPLFENSFTAIKKATIYTRNDGFSVRYLPVSREDASKPRRIRCILDLKRCTSGSDPSLTPMDTVETLAALIKSGRTTDNRMDAKHFHLLLEIADTAEAYRMHYASPQQGVELARKAFASAIDA